MATSKKILLALTLALWLTLIFSTLCINSDNYDFKETKNTVIPDSPQITQNVKLDTPPNLLKVDVYYQNNPQSELPDTTLNNRKLKPQQIAHKKNVQRIYYNIADIPTEKNNTITINTNQQKTKQIKITLRNYRKFFYNKKISTFYKTSLPKNTKLSLLDISSTFIASIIIFISLLSLIQKKYRKKIVFFIIPIMSFLTFILLNNILPTMANSVFIKKDIFWLILTLGSSLTILAAIYKQKSEALNFIEPEISNPEKRWSKPAILIALGSILLAVKIIIIITNHIPMGHDSFQYLQLNYSLFFNELIQHKQLPQWLPFMTNGTNSGIWFVISQNLLGSFLTTITPLLKSINFHTIYQAELLFDELALLLGCILWAKKYFKSIATVLFVASSLTLTTISATQIWFDFHLIYLMPLLLYCMERAFEDISAKYILFSGIIFAGMLIGNLPYFAPIFGFTATVFVITYAMIFKKTSKQAALNFLKNLKLKHLIAILIPACMVLIILIFCKESMKDIINHNQGREDNLNVSLSLFLSYGGNINISKYLELIARGASNINNTIYAGILTVPFIFITALTVRTKKSYVFGITALIMILFSAGIIIPMVFFYCFPFAKYYRHIGLISPLAKLFLIFYAGFGFDSLCNSILNKKNSLLPDISKVTKIKLSVIIATLGYIITLNLFHKAYGNIFKITPWKTTISNQMISVTDIVLIISISLMIVTILIFKFPKYSKIILTVLLLIHLIDVSSFKFLNEYQRTPSVSKQTANLFEPYDYQFQSKRFQNYYANQRFNAILPECFYPDTPPISNDPYSIKSKWGAAYWNTESFIYLDNIASIFRTDHWQKSIDTFFNLYKPKNGWAPRHLGIPIPQSKVFRKCAGIDINKLQTFSKIHALPNQQDIKTIMKNPNYHANILICNSQNTPETTTTDNFIIEQNSNIPLDANDRTSDVDIEITNFSCNQLKLSLNNHSSSNQFLYYADAWNPDWKAFVNGNQTNVIQANLGYKAAMIPSGPSELTFSFGTKKSNFLFHALITIGICAFITIIYLAITDLRK